MEKGRGVRIAVDARCLNTDHLRGMGKYVSELLSHSGPEDEFDWLLLSDRPETRFNFPSGIAHKSDLFDMRGYRFHSWEQVGLPRRSCERKADLLYCTATTLPFWQPIPTVVAVHDTLPWVGQVADRYERWYRHSLIPAAYKKCAAVITISQSSRRDILSLWPGLDQKLHVIPHGVSDIYFTDSRFDRSEMIDNAVGNSPYLLYIGGAIERKRFSWALKVFEALSYPGLFLVACGFSEEERSSIPKQLEQSLRERVRFLPYVPESEMPSLYRHAKVVLYPTLYEGFGFPALEAQAVGAPVFFSDVSSLSELKGPAAETLPVDDLVAWVDACRRVLSQGGFPSRLEEESRLWARRYSWSESAAGHARVFMSVLEGGTPVKE